MKMVHELGLALVVGGALCATYLAMLWYSVRQLSSSRRQALVLAVGALLRLVVVLLGMYAVLRVGGWGHALAAVAGFALVRLFVGLGMATRKGPRLDQGG